MKRKSEPLAEEGKSARNKGGRPTKSPEEINSETFLLYLTPDELIRMKRMHEQEARLRKVSLNQFIKDRFFRSKGTIRPEQPWKIPEEELNKTLVSLLRIDLNLSRFIGNFNQSTKRLNGLLASSQLKIEIMKHADLLLEMSELKPEIKAIVSKLKHYLS